MLTALNAMETPLLLRMAANAPNWAALFCTTELLIASRSGDGVVLLPKGPTFGSMLRTPPVAPTLELKVELEIKNEPSPCSAKAPAYNFAELFVNVQPEMVKVGGLFP